MSGVDVFRLGDEGVLVELDELEQVLALDAAVRARREEGRGALARAVDILPAARTLMVTVPPGEDLTRLGEELRCLAASLGVAAAATGDGEVVEVPVVYDGPDLAEVARLTGLSEAQVVAAHTGTPWRAAFGGFAPGFFYLAGGDPRLEVPRRDEPRTSVPAGAVGLAGRFSGVYPRVSPGGWQLLGRTPLQVWDVDRQPPALLRPGVLVRFVDAGDA